MPTIIADSTTPVRAWLTIDAKAAVLAGRNRYGKALVEIDPAKLTPEERGMLVRLPSLDLSGGRETYGANLYDVTQPANSSTSRDCPAEFRLAIPDASLESVRAAIIAAGKWQAWLAARDEEAAAKRRAERIIAADAWMARSDEELIIPDPYARARRVAVGVDASDHPLAAEILERLFRLQENANQHNSALDARNAENERRKEAEGAAAGMRRRAQIAAWIAEHGTDSQRRRAARKMLPEEEAVSAIRNEAFAPLDALRRYERLKAEDVRAACENDDEEAEVEFRAEDTTEATDVEFARLEEIETVVKGAGLKAVCMLRRHVGICGGCEIQRASVMVIATVGELTLSREFAV